VRRLDLKDYEPFQCDIQPEREAVRLRPAGELDIVTVPVLEAHLSEFVSAGFTHLVLDLRELCFLDSTGLRLILDWDARSRADGVAFSLVAGPPTVQRVFDITDTTRLLTFAAA
jgi:anti-anti-sigma factor